MILSIALYMTYVFKLIHMYFHTCFCLLLLNMNMCNFISAERLSKLTVILTCIHLIC